MIDEVKLLNYLENLKFEAMETEQLEMVGCINMISDKVKSGEFGL